MQPQNSCVVNCNVMGKCERVFQFLHSISMHRRVETRTICQIFSNFKRTTLTKETNNHYRVVRSKTHYFFINFNNLNIFFIH